MAVGLLHSGDRPAARHIGRCAAPPVNHRCAVGLLPLPREEFRQLKLILHSELRRRAASRRALPCPSSSLFFSFIWRSSRLEAHENINTLLTSIRTATRSSRTRKRAFHLYSPGVVRRSHAAVRLRADTLPSGPRGHAFTHRRRRRWCCCCV